MRFLCLHGRGTNTKILQIQTAALRYELGDDHTYVFIEGKFECEMAPEIAHLSDLSVPHFEYYRANNAKSYLSALDTLERYVQKEGPFDGVLGFSQGAGIALMFLIRHAHLYPSTPLPFKVAVLMSRVGVYDPARWLQSGEVALLQTLPLGLKPLRIPVAAIWGSKDWEAVQVEGKTTRRLCCPDLVWEFVHDGAHEPPNGSVEGSIMGAVKIIRRATTEACIIENHKY